MVTFTRKIGLTAILVTLGLASVGLQPAEGATLFPFAYRVDATTHLKKLNQTATVKNGSFTGTIDLDTGNLKGTMTLPATTIKMMLPVSIPLLPPTALVTATAKIVPTKPVTGKVDLSSIPFKTTATATFNIRLVSAYAGPVPVNLVGNNCITSTPMSVTMKGLASIGAPANFSGTFTIPPFKDCQAATTAINQLIPGPGNTFSAHATPK